MFQCLTVLKIAKGFFFPQIFSLNLLFLEVTNIFHFCSSMASSLFFSSYSSDWKSGVMSLP